MENIATPPAASPIVFVGTPPLLSGSLLIDSAPPQKLKLKTRSLEFRPAEGGRGEPSSGHLSATIAANHTGPAMAQLRVDPRMPPGVYHTRIEFGGEIRDVVLNIQARRSLLVEPSRFELAAGEANPVAAVLLVNDGNVPVDVPKVALVPLGESKALHSEFHVALSLKGSEGHQSFLDAYAALLAAAEVDPARAVFGKDGGRTLMPGESLVCEITFELPGNLKKHRLYSGQFMVERTRCAVQLLSENGLR